MSLRTAKELFCCLLNSKHQDRWLSKTLDLEIPTESEKKIAAKPLQSALIFLNQLLLDKCSLLLAESLTESLDYLLLTVNDIQRINRLVLGDELKKGGQWRNSICKPYGSKYFYAHPSTINDRMYSIVDKFNTSIEEIAKANEQEYALLNTISICISNVLSVHPFPDGNGRTCRLILCHSLSALSGCSYPTDNSLEDRQNWIRSLEKCQETTSPEPLKNYLRKCYLSARDK